MFKVVAQGPEPEDVSECTLSSEPVICGREAAQAKWVIPWDRQISRLHFQLRLEGDAVRITRLPQGRNPLFYHDLPSDEFAARAGECFQAGQTLFQVFGEPESRAVEPPPSNEFTGYFNARELKEASYEQAPAQLEALSGLPEMIRRGGEDETFYPALLEILLNALPSAAAAAVIFADPADPASLRPRYWHRRGAAADGRRPPAVSLRLIQEAVRANTIAFYRWGDQSVEFYTISGEFTWALAAPVPVGLGEVQVLYVAGRKPRDSAALAEDRADTLRDDAKFVHLLAEMLSAFRQVQRLQDYQQAMLRFFPPKVREMIREMITAGGSQALEARLIDISVMFCDLMGFSKRAEEMARRGQLDIFSEQIRDVLDIMTQGIHAFEGTVGDQLGDAALGYWGWPVAQPNDVSNACQAALKIAAGFHAQARQSASSGLGIGPYRCAISIATGPAVVGELGARNLPKVGLLGPVVNLASRLNGIAGILQVPIIVERATIDQLDPESYRVRRLGRVQPAKLDTIVEVFELLSPATDNPDALTEEQVKEYERGLAAFEQGDWHAARRTLAPLVAFDGPAQFLIGLVLGKQGRSKPPAWEGVIRLETKD